MTYSPMERPKRLVDAKVRKDGFFSPKSVDTSKIDPHYPSARIRRLEAKSPHFRSNRKAWRKFYIWQERMGHRIWLSLRHERRAEKKAWREAQRNSCQEDFTS